MEAEEKIRQEREKLMRSQMKSFMKSNKVLRFSEKMHNVSEWKKNQINYAKMHGLTLKAPEIDPEVESITYDHKNEEPPLKRLKIGNTSE
jgi:hypothetical protein